MSRIPLCGKSTLFTVYAPAGITPEAVRRHLEDIAAAVRLVAPAAVTDSMLATVLAIWNIR